MSKEINGMGRMDGKGWDRWIEDGWMGWDGMGWNGMGWMDGWMNEWIDGVKVHSIVGIR